MTKPSATPQPVGEMRDHVFAVGDRCVVTEDIVAACESDKACIANMTEWVGREVEIIEVIDKGGFLWAAAWEGDDR